MNLPTSNSLKPIDLSAAMPSSASALSSPNTRLSLSDLSGIISHPKRNAAPAAGADPAALQHERLVQQTQQWVAQTFFGTMLKQMRDSPFKSDLFEGGRGGQAFSSMYDQKLVEHMSRGAGKKLVGGIVRRLEAGAAYRKQQKESPRALEGVEPSGTNRDTGTASDFGAGRSAGFAAAASPLLPKSPDKSAADVNPFQKVRIRVAPAFGS